MAEAENKTSTALSKAGLPLEGLTPEEAQRRLAADGPNELPSAKPRSLMAITLGVMREPMFLLLIAGGAVYMLLGDIQEALLLLSFVVIVIGITISQERKTENALKALQSLSSPRARVIRGGREFRIAGREVVRGDLVLVSEGDRIPADGAIVDDGTLLIDESLLTGESVSVQRWGEGPDAKPGNDSLVFSGTLAVQGQAVVEVLQTGPQTKLGLIGRSLQSVETEKTHLEKDISLLVRNLAIAGISLSLLLVVIYGIFRGNWLQGALAGVALAMAMLPEEFPVVLTIFLALGAWRISKRQVLTRRMPAVETLGAATMLCVDKTGTLTLNRMSVGRLFADGETFDLEANPRAPLPEIFHRLVEYSILASQRDPFDPMEKAFHRLGAEYLSQTEHLHDDWVLVRQYPLSGDLLAMSHVWRDPEGRDYLIAAKGAPEAVADLCHMDDEESHGLMEHVGEMAAEGLRVIGVTSARFRHDGKLPGEQHDFDFQFIGLVGLLDPIRPDVPGAIAECRQAGIRVMMITGDYPATARHIGAEIGLPNPECVLTGVELDELEDGELEARIPATSIFARMVPEQKLRLVQVLKSMGEVVGMTGDGVNDAPALKAADIGIAMGGRGTDVAREAAGLVLVEDDFSSIVTAIRMGRRIFDNMRKAMAYVLAVHVPIAGLSLLPIILHWPLILHPLQIVLLELIIDPACSIVFEAEPEEKNVMDRPPRPPGESIFTGPVVYLSLAQGLSMLLVSLVVFLASLHFHPGSASARTMAFFTLVMANLSVILSNISWSRSLWANLKTPNKAKWWIITGTPFFLVMMIHVPAIARLFGFHPLSFYEMGICLFAGMVSVLWFEVLKIAWGRRAMARG